MIRLLLLVGVVLAGTAPSALGSIIVSKLADDANCVTVSESGMAPAPSLPTLVAPSSLGSLAATSDPFLSGLGTGLTADLGRAYSFDLLPLVGDRVIDLSLDLPAPPVCELLRPPEV